MQSGGWNHGGYLRAFVQSGKVALAAREAMRGSGVRVT